MFNRPAKLKLNAKEEEIKVREVEVIDRAELDASWGQDNYRIRTKTIRVPWVCPKCGGPRGHELRRSSVFEDGSSAFPHTWDNPCGHKDTYAEMVKEAARFAKNA